MGRAEHVAEEENDVSPSLLLLLAPFAFLVWRPDWPGVAVLLGAMALVAWRDWAAAKTDWNGSVSVDIDHLNHALKTLRSEVERNDKDARGALEMATGNIAKIALQVKASEEMLSGLRAAVQQASSKPRGLL